MPEKFLQQVAHYYLSKDTDLTKTTFVLPNRRSALFLRKYMQQWLDDHTAVPHFMPRMITITQFTQQYDSSALASNPELVFLLYRAYCNVVKDSGIEPKFDSFYYWGTIILNDFNDIDANFANPSELYKNLEGLKKIRANYLTDDQKDVIRYLWGPEAVPPDSDRMWRDFSSAQPDTASARFIELWQIMLPLYTEFQRLLDAQPVPLSYSGLQSRRAYETIREMGAEDFDGRRYAFVGFSVLSNARTLIFKHLNKLGVADFFWDIASDFVKGDFSDQSSAGRYIMSLARRFKMPEGFSLSAITTTPDIEIIGVPSNFGQAKVASTFLRQWAKEWIESSPEHKISDSDLVDTAVVMADDSLLTPVLYSIPDEIDSINVTMGMSYMATPFAALMSAIISMHLRAVERNHSIYYFYQDVIEVLSHPHISLILPEESAALKSHILTQHIYNVSAQEIIDNYPSLKFIFAQIDNKNSIRDVRGYIDNLVATLRTLLTHSLKSESGHEYYELKVLEGYAAVVEEICDLLEKYNIQMHERTFLHMIERALSLSVTNFVGKPLRGLQIMSVKDTRAIDFDNLIFLSMNERIFPSRSYTPSFIPMSLRSGFGLPTQDQQDSSLAYQFYRLISRAKRVKLLYDNRTSGISSGEMSRFLSQLVHLRKGLDIKQRVVSLRSDTPQPQQISIDKTPRVMEQLKRFLAGGDRNISASALKTYLSCPLKFYLQYVMRMRPDDDVLEYIDAASYGTVIHKVVQDLYDQYATGIIDLNALKRMEDDDIEHRTLVTLNEKYYKGRFDGRLDRIPGEGQVISRIIAQYVRRMLKAERRFVPYRFQGAEVGEGRRFQWRINDKYSINFTMSIDRIDSFTASDGNTALRFIDYKTGSDELSAKDLGAVFTDHNLGGMFQILLYCHAYASDDNSGYKGTIHPVIYKFQSIPKDGIVDLSIAKTKISDYHQVDGFYPMFEDLIHRIFEDENKYPFAQTEDVESCKYCPFCHICSRYVTDN